MHVKAKANRERPVKVTVLKELVHVRFRDGEALLKTGEQQRRIGAIYVAGYGIECALKARAAPAGGVPPPQPAQAGGEDGPVASH